MLLFTKVPVPNWILFGEEQDPEDDKPQLEGAGSPKSKFNVIGSGQHATVLVGVIVKFVGITPTVTVLL